jgi:uncharacterized protein (TIGR02588 family)
MSRQDGGGRTTAEWVTLALSLLVIGGLVSLALREELTHEALEGGQLNIEFDIDNVEFRDGNFFVPYIVTNTGSEAILLADIWFDIYQDEHQVSSAEVRVQFLPLRGAQSGVFVTPYDPATHEMYGRVETMQFP